MKDEEYIYWRIPRNKKPWPNATFGTIRGFFLSGVLLGFCIGLLVGTWIGLWAA